MAAFVISKAKQQIKAGKVFSFGSRIKTFCKKRRRKTAAASALCVLPPGKLFHSRGGKC